MQTTEWGKLLTKSIFSGTISLQVWRKKYNTWNTVEGSFWLSPNLHFSKYFWVRFVLKAQVEGSVSYGQF